MIWPRSAILHSAAASSVDLILGLTVSTADRIATLRLGDAQHVGQVDGVLDDVALVFDIGRDVDGGVGDQQRAGIGRHVHQIDVADPPRGAQAGVARQTACMQFVGVQIAFHQQRALRRRAPGRPPAPRRHGRAGASTRR